MKSTRAVCLALGFAFCAAASAVGAERPVDFRTEVVPVFTKAGCNAGACHGAAIGRGGFKLSLYGGDPEADYDAVVRQLEGRRINLARPAESLLLRKPTGRVSHEGGLRLKPNAAGAQRLQRWIAAGAPAGGNRRLVKFTVSPQRKVVQKPGEAVTLRAVAAFSDGTSEDVTGFTVFTPDDPSAVEVSRYAPGTRSGGVATLKRRGEHIVVARFLDRVVPLRLTVPLADVPVDHSSQPRANFIDDEILTKLESLRLPVAPGISDDGFLRRATLDLTGRLPTLEQVRTFQKDVRKDKRVRLVDDLLKSDAFVDYWTFRFAELLRIRSAPKEKQGAETYHNWLREQLQRGTGFDKTARTLLTATGDSHEFGPANFYRTAGDARNQAEFVSELFLGARLRCANCHNHPLDKWTQDDYHGFAAIFAKVRTGRVVTVGESGEVVHPRSGEPAVPRIPGERFLNRPDEADAASPVTDKQKTGGEKIDGRAEFADWLTAPGNPYFAKAAVNRLWQALMGRGLVEPADDLRDTNPATHPELLNRLADDFERNGYDLRRTLRLIATSAAYARSEAPAAGKTGGFDDDRYYSRAVAKKMESHVLVDAVCDVTGVAEKFGGEPLGKRAVNLFDGNTPSAALDVLGRCDRSGSCESGGTTGGGLTAKLHWINGEFLNGKIGRKDGRLNRLIAAGRSNEQIVEEFYLRALGRKPAEKEHTFWKKQFGVAAGEKRRELLQDFVWSLLSCSEFQTR